MTYRIGGDFELTEELLTAPERGEKLSFVKYHLLVDTGRSAIFVALQEILMQTTIKKAWLPYYCCPTIVTSFYQLKFDVHFYGMGENLLDPEGLPESLDNTIILFIHYFGKINHPLVKLIQDQQNNGEKIIVIEDCVQTCCAPRENTNGDFIIHSLRKFLPVPDGGIVESNQPIQTQTQIPDETYISGKMLAKLVRGWNGQEKEFLRLYEHAEQRLETFIIPKQMSFVSQFILRKLDFKAVHQQRRNHWHQLSQAFDTINSDLMVPLYSSLEPEEIPLVFPIVVGHGLRNKLKTFLADRHIFCPVHWNLTHKNVGRLFESDYLLSQVILSIPIDQRITNQALDYLIDQLHEFEKDLL